VARGRGARRAADPGQGSLFLGAAKVGRTGDASLLDVDDIDDDTALQLGEGEEGRRRSGLGPQRQKVVLAARHAAMTAGALKG
jgi:hypothetical protein